MEAFISAQKKWVKRLVDNNKIINKTIETGAKLEVSNPHHVNMCWSLRDAAISRIFHDSQWASGEGSTHFEKPSQREPLKYL